MLTGKKLVDTLTAELGEIGMGNMASELDAMYRSPEFLELDLLSAIARLVETEYQARTNKRITNRLRAAHLLGCPQDITSCVDSSERAYLPAGITRTYLVETVTKISSSDWSYLSSTTDNRITLLTCVAGDSSQRWCVQAVQAS